MGAGRAWLDLLSLILLVDLMFSHAGPDASPRPAAEPSRTLNITSSSLEIKAIIIPCRPAVIQHPMLLL